MFSCYLRNWSAWAPGLETRDDWESWAKSGCDIPLDGAPSVAFLPSQLRRRLSRISKISLEVAHRCCPEELIGRVRSVFTTRHGESATTIGLLRDIATDELFSPAAFSHSVYNTSAGYFSIFTGNTQPSTSIAAGRESFAYAFLESIMLTQRYSGEPVLLVLALEPIAEYYHCYVNESQVTLGLGLLLSDAGPGEKLRFSYTASAPNDIGARPQPMGLDFLKWIVGQSPHLECSGERMTWRWDRCDNYCDNGNGTGLL